ncbi:hypothetical protein P6144_16335 [Sphingomonas sp. HITSZ_GF]|uniref:DUF6894 family protein n=1 Tax=Sphingomonas sp. HITSZ_GF TaxID=3037247 RepID=UPI00240DBD74|nr:hypothetical protein [Sphingomonas sp. HITSZ_GF]MDG2535230.1 hypothetical protein [Sphingomonas sp. HITSZ_GF]
MPLYHFQVTRHGDAEIFGRESHDCRDLPAALGKAHARARAFLRRYARCRPEELRGTLDIEDARNHVVARIYLSELAHQIS